MSDGGDSVDYRPPSDNLVDLHISIVPMEHWVERLNYASHKVIADTFSVGFIRVLPDTPLAKLRNDMRLQLGENFFPKSYVFLKHIGRCLALVRKSQEKQLKVKTFLPPQSIMPEIFVLPGQPNMYNYSVLPPITPKMQDLHKPFSEPESISPELVPETIYKQHTPTQQRFEDSDPVSESHESQQLVRHGSHKQKAIVDQLRRSMENDRHDSNKSVYRSQAASPPASKDIKRQKRHISGKSSLTGENPNKPIFPRGQRGRTTPGQASDAMSPFKHPEDHVLVERSQPSQAKSVLHEGPQKRKVHYNMPNRSSTNSSQAYSNVDPLESCEPNLFNLPHLHDYKMHDSLGNHNHIYSNPSITSSTKRRRQFINTSPQLPTNPTHPKHAVYLSTHHSNNPMRKSKEYSLHDRPISGTSSNASYQISVSHGSPVYGGNLPTLPFDPQTLTTGLESRGISQSSIVMEEKPPTNSTNNDSGYMEQDQSDSDDSTINKMKMRLLSGSTSDHKQEAQKQPQSEVFESSSMVWDNNRALLTKSTVLERQHSFKNQHTLPLEDKSATVNKPQRTLPPATDNARLGDISSNNDVPLPSAITKQISHENLIRETERSFSQEESHQNDFVEHSGSKLSTESGQNGNEQETLKTQNELAKGEEFASGFSNHFSEMGNYQQANNPTSPHSENDMEKRQMSGGYNHGKTADFKQIQHGTETSHEDNVTLSVTPPQNKMPYSDGWSLLQPKYMFPRNEVVGSDADNEEEDDEDGYESSEDEFQKELNFMTIQHQQNMEKEQTGESSGGESDHQPSIQFDVFTGSDTEKTKVKSVKSAEQKNVDVKKFEESKEDGVVEKDQMMKRESISGLSEHNSPIIPPSGTTAVIAFVTTATRVGNNDMAVAKQFLGIHDETVIDQKDTDEPEKVMSRGDPDGMPTQRKVNTGGSDKLSAKANIISNHAKQKRDNEAPFHQKNQLTSNESDTDVVTQVKTVKHEDVEVSKSKLIEKPVEKIPTKPENDREDNVKQTDVQKEITHQASPSPIRIPKFHKPAVEQQEVVTTPASSPRPNESKSSSAKHEPPPQVSTVKQENETEKRLGSSDRAKLWSQLQNARNSRRLAEKERQDLVKQAKVTTSKLNQKRTSVRDMWKKKFFEEKKRTMPLEDICRRLQSELDTSHRRLVSALEGEKISEKRRYPTFLPSVTSRPSVKSNSKIQVTRLQHDIDGLRRKIEDAKIKLTGEIKLRHQAEEDVKIVRRELLTKKIRAHVAYREAIRGNGFSVRA